MEIIVMYFRDSLRVKKKTASRDQRLITTSVVDLTQREHSMKDMLT